MVLTFNITKSGSIAFSAYAETGSAGFSAKITLNGVEDTLYSHAPTHSSFCKVIKVKEGDVLEINHIDQYEQLMVMIGRYAISNTAERLNKPVKIISPEDTAEYTISGELTTLGDPLENLEDNKPDLKYYKNMFYNGSCMLFREVTFHGIDISRMYVYIKNETNINSQNESISKEVVSLVRPNGVEGTDYQMVRMMDYLGHRGFFQLIKPLNPVITRVGYTWVLHAPKNPPPYLNERLHYNFIPPPKPNREDYSDLELYREAEQKMLQEWYDSAFDYDEDKDIIEINQYFDAEIYVFVTSQYEPGYVMYSDIVSDVYNYFNKDIPKPIISFEKKGDEVYFKIDKNSEDPNLVTRYYIYEEYNYDGVANYDRYFGYDIGEDKDGNMTFNVSKCYHEPLSFCNDKECKVHNGNNYRERNYWRYYDLDSFGGDEETYQKYTEAMKLLLPDVWYYTGEKNEDGTLKRYRKIKSINFRIYALNEYDADHDDSTINSSYGQYDELSITV